MCRTSTEKDKVKTKWEKAGASIILFALPRDGKTITMYTDALPFINGGIPKEALKEVTETMWE